MAVLDKPTQIWHKIAHTQTHSDTAEEDATVPERYGLTVGFENNHPEAFVGDVQNTTTDMGHAFFYITRNDTVVSFFSFGPDGDGSSGIFNPIPADAMARHATPDYDVTDAVQLFRLKLTKDQALGLMVDTDIKRTQAQDGKIKYIGYLNDTCAETARDILKKEIPNIPDGSGPVITYGYHSYVSVVNPYMWQKRFKDKGYIEHDLPGIRGARAKNVKDKNYLIEREPDPLTGIPFEDIK